MSTTTPPNALYEPNAAVAWLLARHATPRRLVDRLGAWLKAGELPDVDRIAWAVNDYDRHRARWQEYSDRHPVPDDEDRYNEWEAAGPADSIGTLANVIGPMSGGEKRMLRMLGMLADSTPAIRFCLSDIDGVDAEFRTDWRRLVAGDDWRPECKTIDCDGCP